MIGVKIGKLTVKSYSHTSGKRAFWNCKCDCGKTKKVMGKYLRKNEVKSCGCLNRQPLNGEKIKHGHATNGISKTYSTWSGMIQRCENPKSKRFYRYGGRGIIVCEKWKEFKNFLKDMGEKPLEMTIGRKNNNGNYCKQNCQWETTMQQGSNTSRNRIIEYKGIKLHLAEWSRRIGIKSPTLHTRIKKYGIEKAFDKTYRPKSYSNRIPFGRMVQL